MIQTFLVVLIFSIWSNDYNKIQGKWVQSNDENIAKSILNLYIDKNKLYAQVSEILDINNKKAICKECTGKNKDKPIEKMVIVEGLTFQDNYWQGGKILDPNNGRYYKCYIEIIDENTISVRGYIGISFFGRSQTWKRLTKN